MNDFDIKVLKNILTELEIPFNMHFYNMRLSHYIGICEKIGKQKMQKNLSELLIYHKDNVKTSNKIRTIINFFNKNKLIESNNDYNECDCGIILNDDFDKCPICDKILYTGIKCFYKNTDSSCAIDGKDCVWNNTTECMKLYNKENII